MTKPITPDELPIWVPGTLTVDSASMSWAGVRLVGYKYAGSDVAIPPLRDYLLVTYREGATPMHRRCSGAWQTNEMLPGSISFLSHAQQSHWRWSENIEVLHLYLSPEMVAKAASDLYQREISEVNLRDVLRADDPILAGLVAGFAQETKQGGLGSGLYVQSLQQAVSIHLLRHYAEVAFREPETRGRLSSHQCRRLTSYVEDNLERAVTLAELAGTVSLSIFHFTRKFRTTFGCPPHVYVMRRRLDMAKRLLARPELPLKVVAVMCGFSDQSHMTRVFRTILDTTPAGYRRHITG